MLTNSSILAQPENNAADRQIYMIIVITDNKAGAYTGFFKGGFQ